MVFAGCLVLIKTSKKTRQANSLKVVAPKKAPAYISLFLACTVKTTSNTKSVKPDIKKNIAQKPGTSQFSNPAYFRAKGTIATRQVNNTNEIKGFKFFNSLMIL